MARRKKPIDKVRASRDGHEYHETWVARKSLQLLNPESELTAIAIEGLSPVDQKSATSKETEIADVTLYYEGTSFRKATRVSILQFKYSIANKDKEFRATDSKKTVDKFAEAYREHIKRYGANASKKLRFQLVTNQAIYDPLIKAVSNLANGIKNNGEALSQEKQFQKAAKLTGKQLVEFASLCDFLSSVNLLNSSKKDLENRLISLSASRDSIAIARLGKMKELVREKAGSAGDSKNIIQRTDVLASLSISDLNDMLPCPEDLPDWGESIEREQMKNTIKVMEKLNKPLVVHAAGGVGKTVFMKSLAEKISEDHEVVFFDSFGGGAYRSVEDARHLPKRGLVHIANTLSFRGLCDPVLPNTSDEQGLIKAFRQRLEQCLETASKIKQDRKIFLFIDAIDNAEIEASRRKESSFSKILLESFYDNPIKDVNLIVSCRSERKPTTYAKYSEIELRPFSQAETSTFLNNRLEKTTTLFIDSAFSRSGGNARVLEYLIGSEGTNTKDNSQINLDDLLTKKIEGAIENAVKRGCPEKDLTTFLSGLTMLAPPVKVEDYALANNVDTNAIESMVSDLAPLIEKSKHGVIFKDEPTETLILKIYGTQSDNLEKIAENLSIAQDTSVFAAKVLPNLLYQLGDGEKLYSLALDKRFPSSIQSTMGRRRIKLSRLRVAAKYAVEQDDLNKLVGLLVELSSLAEVDQRGISYLLHYPELVVASDDSDAIRRIFETRTIWPGTRHARLGLIDTLYGELAEAHTHISSLCEWIEHYFRTDRNSKFGFREEPESIDYASIPIFSLAKKQSKRAADYFSRWKDWHSFEIGEHFYACLSILKEKKLITAKEIDSFHCCLSSIGGIIASLRFYEHPIKVKKELLKSLARLLKKQKVGLYDLAGIRNDLTFQKSILSASLAAFELDYKSDAKNIFASLEKSRPRVYAFRDHYHDKSATVFILMAIVNATINKKKNVSLIDLLPAELFVLGQNIKKTDAAEFCKELQSKVSDYLKKSVKDKDRTIRKEDTRDIDSFINNRFLLMYEFSNKVFAFIRTSRQSGIKFESVISSWEEISKNKNVYRPSVTDHFWMKVGFDLIIFSLNSHQRIQAKYARKLATSENLKNLSANIKTDLVKTFASIYPNEDLAGELAGKLVSQIEHENDVSSRANLFAGIAQSLLSFNKDESIEYFSKGLLAVDAIGSGDYRYVNELLIFAASLHGDELDSKDFHALSNICEINMEGEPDKFYWEPYGSAFSKIAGLRGLAQLARWDDRQKVELSCTLLPYLIALVRDKKISSKDAVALNYIASPVEYWVAGTADFARELASSKNLSRIEVEELIHQYQLNHTGTSMHSTIESLAKFAEETLGQSSSEYMHLAGATPKYKELIDKTNHHINLHSSSSDIKFKKSETTKRNKNDKIILSLIKKTKPECKKSFDESLAAFNKLDRAYDLSTFYFSKLRGKVHYQNRKEYIENISESNDDFKLYWKIEELKECKSAWSSSSSSLAGVFKKAGMRLLHKHSDEFVGDDYLSSKNLEGISEFTGVPTSDLIGELVKICTQHDSIVSGSIWISFASFLNAKAEDGIAQIAIKKLLSSEASKLGELASDGQWKPELYPTGESDKILAEMIWKKLGSSNANDRWMAAHSVRCFAKFDRWSVLSQLVGMINRRNAGSFQASSHNFFDYHARLWLLIAFARLSKDYPRQIESFKPAIEPYTKINHVILRHFASKIILECAKTNPSFITEQKRKSLTKINSSSFPIFKKLKKQRLNSYQDRPQTAPSDQYKFSLEYDFRKIDVDSLGRVFGIDCWQVEDLIAESACEIDPNISSMYDSGGRENYRRYSRDHDTKEQTYSEQVAWHALHISAGKLLSKYPVTDDYWGDDAWGEWLSSYLLTRKDEFWLSDTLDLIPLDIKNILLEEKGKSLVLTEKKNVLLGLANIVDSINDTLIIGGRWNSIDGVEVNISSAFVTKELSKISAATLSKKDPWQLWVPRIENDDDSMGYSRNCDHNLIPWLISNDTHARLDQYDTYGSVVGCDRYRIANDIVEGYKLKCSDQFSRFWHDESGKLILKSEAWRGPTTVDGTDEEYSGLRLHCDTNFLGQILSDCELSLILVIRLQRYQKDYRTSGEFSHSFAVVEINEKLEFKYRKGSSIVETVQNSVS